MASRLKRRLAARFARPQSLFLSPDGVQLSGSKPVAFSDWCRDHPGEAADVVVSSKLLHELVCEAGLPLGDEAKLQAYARQLYGHYFGSSAKTWPLATWRVAGESPGTEQCGVVALHGAVGAQLQELAAANQVRLVRVQPAWAAALRRIAEENVEWAQSSRAMLVWVEGQVVTCLELQHGLLRNVRQRRLSEPTLESLSETLLDVADLGAGHAGDVLVCGYGLDDPAEALIRPGLRRVGRLSGSAPEPGFFDAHHGSGAARLPKPDFLGPRLPRSPMAWPLAGVGAVAMIASLWSAVQSHQNLRQVQAQHQGLKAEVQAIKKPRSSTPTTQLRGVAAGSKAQPKELDGLRSAIEVQYLLLHPWQAVLVNVEQAGAEASAISWLGLEYNAVRQDLRLDGLAVDKPAALQMVDRLTAAPGWQAVVLSRFQVAEQGLVGQRFELSAKLRPAGLRLDLPPKGAGERGAP